MNEPRQDKPRQEGDGQLGEVLTAALRPSVPEPDPARVAALRLRVIESANAASASRVVVAGDRPSAQPRPWIGSGRRPKRRRWPIGPVLAGAAAVALAVVAGFAVGRLDSDGPAPLLRGTATAVDANAAARADIEVSAAGAGRQVRLQGTDLAPPEPGSFYELWFARIRASDGGLEAISAGTFRPGPNGSVSVRFDTAADPTQFQLMLVTLEPGDGDPLPSGDVVLQLQLP